MTNGSTTVHYTHVSGMNVEATCSILEIDVKKKQQKNIVELF